MRPAANGLFGRNSYKLQEFCHLPHFMVLPRRGAGVAPPRNVGKAPEDRQRNQVVPPGRGRFPVSTVANKKPDSGIRSVESGTRIAESGARTAEPASLVISVEKRGTRNLIVSIRGSTVGVLVALAILAAAAWLLIR